MYFVLFFSTLLLAKMNTSYDDDLLFKKYVTIKNPTLAKILINQQKIQVIKYSRTKNTKANRKKLLIPGLIFYILSIILMIFSIILRYCIHPIYITNYEVSSKYNLIVDTLNEKVPIILSVALIYLELFVYSINTFQYQNNRRKGFEKKINTILGILVIMFVAFSFIYLIYATVSDFIKYWY